MKIFFYCFLSLYIISNILHINADDLSNTMNTIDNKTKIIELASAHILSRAIHTVAQLKVADYMMSDPQNITELAHKTQLNENALYRLLRFLASYGIFHHDEHNNFSLTPLSQ